MNLFEDAISLSISRILDDTITWVIFSRFETFFWISKESWIANYFWVLNKSFLEKVILVIVFQIYNNFSIRIYF